MIEIIYTITVSLFVIVGLIVFMKYISTAPNNYKSNYLYNKGDIVYHYDPEIERVVELKIRHRISGWTENDWEYYNCITTNYVPTIEEGIVYEPSQNEICKTKKEAEQIKRQYLRSKIAKLEEKIRKYKDICNVPTEGNKKEK